MFSGHQWDLYSFQRSCLNYAIGRYKPTNYVTMTSLLSHSFIGKPMLEVQGQNAEANECLQWLIRYRFAITCTYIGMQSAQVLQLHVGPMPLPY